MIPGQYITAAEDIVCNEDKEVTKLTIVNTGDRPVQIGSHFHFFEVNRQMAFERTEAFGKRLNIAAGTAVRFEPGEEKEVELVPFGGAKKVFGFSNLVDGTVDEAAKQKALESLPGKGFKGAL